MIKKNVENIQKKKNELIYFKGYIPPQLFFHLTAKEQEVRMNFLKINGLYDEINERDMIVNMNLRKADDEWEYIENVFKEWIVDNPRFKDCIIVD